MLRRQRRQFLIRAAVELDEHQVPDLDHVRRTRVDELAALPSLRAVIVDLGAWAARAGVAHFPEVVLLVAQMNVRRVDVRLEAPQRRGLVVARQALRFVALEDRRVQAGLVELPFHRQQLPRPADRLLLEVVAERPVAEHLEEGVVVRVLADVVEVVVLAAGADALLRVGRALVGRLLGAEEVRLELVHAGVGEQQRRVVVRHDTARRHEGVAVLLDEEVDELLADLVGGQHAACSNRTNHRDTEDTEKRQRKAKTRKRTMALPPDLDS